MTMSLPARLGLACAIAASVAAATGTASAQEGVAVKSILGKMGIIPEEKDAIQYRERAPLVLPPKSSGLREPIGQTDYASANPQWPTDPDVAARRRRDAEALIPMTQTETRRMSNNNPALTPDELRAGRTASNSQAVLPGRSHRGDNARDVLILNPDQLNAGRRTAAEADEEFLAEPPRRTLVEPPAGMRRSATGKRVDAIVATPKVDQQAIDANPLAWIRKQFGRGDDDE